jgi:two-component system chemotaxis response regulator CheB
MNMSKLIVIGASAGGMEALTRLVEQLPNDCLASVFIVHHMAPDTSGTVLLNCLKKITKLRCTEARDGESIKAGHIYLAPTDHHMLVNKGKILVTKGARENRWRPGIDPLFRSAAVAYQSRVIGVVLTGYLNDGTAGLEAIQRCGGICIVQDPSDAAYPDMPQNALNRINVDYCVPLAEMGALFAKLLLKKPGKEKAPPNDIVIEAKIAERVLSDLTSVKAVGHQVPFNCPGCGGVLWEVDKGSTLRFRCHTGHSYTGQILLADQTAKIEETLWIALRMFEERRNLLDNMSKSGARGYSPSAGERAKESEIHIKRIRTLLRSNDKATPDSIDP